MDPELARLAATLDELGGALSRLEARVRHLEGEPASEPSLPVATEQAARTPLVPLFGRSLILLGGAYLLRAATDRAVFPQWLGAVAALGYAGVLVLLADRAAARSQEASAAFHGAMALVIGGPLVDELAVRLHLVSPATAGAMAVGLGGSLGWVAHHRRQPLLGWFAVSAAALVAAILAVQTQNLAPSLALVAAAVGGGALLARTLRQPAMLALPLTVGCLLSLWLVQLTLSGGGPSPDATLAALFGFFVAGAVGAWWSGASLHIRGVEAGLLLPVVLGPAARLAEGRVWFGASLLAVGAGGFALARRQPARFFSGYWLLVALVALSVLGSGSLLVVLYLAVLSLLLVLGSGSFEVMAALVAVAAASGLFEFALRALSFPSVPPPRAMAGVALLAAAVVAAVRPHPVALLILCFGVAGLAAWAGLALWSPSAAAAAALRTSVLAAMAVGLALLSRLGRLRVAGSLVYPLLAAVGLKLLVDDFPAGTSATLFVDLAVCGTALIVAPRLRQRQLNPAAQPLRRLR
jgi:hypothetical protein